MVLLMLIQLPLIVCASISNKRDISIPSYFIIFLCLFTVFFSWNGLYINVDPLIPLILATSLTIFTLLYDLWLKEFIKSKKRQENKVLGTMIEKKKLVKKKSLKRKSKRKSKRKPKRTSKTKSAKKVIKKNIKKKTIEKTKTEKIKKKKNKQPLINYMQKK
ncbi:MAG: hypothetical protein GF364_18415 [Candidatus Lokiarchaeota archaeon]|nr:hypothetical protein [Candidatus Lokiarchaeota archaeon]